MTWREVITADPMIAVYIVGAICAGGWLIGYPLLKLAAERIDTRRKRRLEEDARESVAFDAGRPNCQLPPSLPRFFDPPSTAAGSTDAVQGRRNDQARARVVNFPELQERSGYDGTNLQLVTRQGERIH